MSEQPSDEREREEATGAGPADGLLGRLTRGATRAADVARKTIEKQRPAAERAVRRTGLAAVAVADAIDQALVISAAGDVDALRGDQFNAAAAAFGEYAARSVESIKCFEALEARAFAMTPSAGRA